MFTLVPTSEPANRVLWLDRPLEAASGRCLRTCCEDAAVFADAYGEGQVFLPRARQFEDAARAGRFAALYTAPRHGCLIGVAASWQSEDDDDLTEIGPVVVRPDHRRCGLGAILAQALAVQECSETQSFSGVVVVTTEDNVAGRTAIRALAGPLHGAAEMVRCNPDTERFVDQAETRVATMKRGALYALVSPATFCDGARMLLAARSPGGLALKTGTTLRLGAGWYRYDEGFWEQVALIARGWMPRSPTRPRRLSA